MIRYRALRAVAVIGMGFLAAIAAGADAKKKPATLVEIGHDGMFELRPGDSNVDVNSPIEIRFADPELGQVTALATSDDWQRVHAALLEVDRIMRKRIALNQRLVATDPKDAAAVAKFQEDAKAAQRETATFVDMLQTAAALSDATVDRILSGKDLGGTPETAFANLTRWLNSELRRLENARKAMVNDKVVEYTVQAFHRPPNGVVKAVAVQNYDHLPIGKLEPVPRNGLQMSEREQQRLKMELEAAEKAAALIRKVASSTEELEDSGKKALQTLQKALADLETSLKATTDKIEGALKDKTWSAAPRALAAAPAIAAEAKAALTQLADALDRLQENWTALRAVRTHLTALKAMVNAGSRLKLSEVVAGDDSVLTSINTFSADLGNDAKNLATLPENVATVGKAIAAIPPTISPQFATLSNLVTSDRELFNKLSTDLKPVLDLIDQFKALLPKTAELAAAGAGLEPPAVDSIWRTDHMTGRIELARAGLAEGDEVLIKVRSRPAGVSGAPETVDDYYMHTALLGWHRKFDGHLIFARAKSGTADAKKWKPNAAAMVHWHYRFRTEAGESTPFKSFINDLYPGLGLHVASLDQGNDSVEFGVGLNLTLWQGLLSGGFGYNLNNNGAPYYYLGIGLLDVLQKVQTFSAPAPKH